MFDGLNLIHRGRQALLLATFMAAAPIALATVPAPISYQGRLDVSGSPAAGEFDFLFTLHDAESGGTTVAGPVVADDLVVTGGLFSTQLNFGGGAPFTGQDLWLQVAVRPGNETGAFTTLGGRVPLSTVPYAHRAGVADSAATAANSQALNGLPSTAFAAADHGHSELRVPSTSAPLLAINNNRELEVFPQVAGGPLLRIRQILGNQLVLGFASQGAELNARFVETPSPEVLLSPNSSTGTMGMGIVGHAPAANGDGGSVSIRGGNAPAGFSGGAVEINGGEGGAGATTGGDVLITAGRGNQNGGSTGGNVVVRPGVTPGGTDGTIQLRGRTEVTGQFSITSQVGGLIEYDFRAPLGPITPRSIMSIPNSDFEIVGAPGNTAASIPPGNIRIDAGDGDATGTLPGGTVTITGGEGSEGGGGGGPIVLAAGSGRGPGDNFGGSILLQTGLPTGNGPAGVVRVVGPLIVEDPSAPPQATVLDVTGNVRVGSLVRFGNSDFISNPAPGEMVITANNTLGAARFEFVNDAFSRLFFGSGEGGQVAITSPAPNRFDLNGEDISIQTASGIVAGEGSGGNLNLIAGNGSSEGLIGALGGNGGNVQIFAGQGRGTGSNSGGNIVLEAGAGSNGGADGAVIIRTPRLTVGLQSAPLAGRVIDTNTGAHLTNAGVWTSVSDRDAKTDFAAVNPVEVLDRLLDLPLATFRYHVEQPGTVHLGPTAQDFAASFGLGTTDHGIGTVDADGVAFAAIQGLHHVTDQRLVELEAENAALRERLERLEAALQDLAERRP